MRKWEIQAEVMAYLIRGKTRIKPRPDERNGKDERRKRERGREE